MITGLTVRVPASAANIGPGFDTLAFALDWYNEIRVEPGPSLEVTAEGEGADEIGPDNLVVRAMERVLGATPRAKFHLLNRVPFGRGFGSSATAIVAGLVAANAMEGDPMQTSSLLEMAVDIEGHADNVSACLLGGFTVSLPGTSTARLPCPDGWSAVVCVAPTRLATEAARKGLPQSVAFPDAVATAGRVARLVAAIAQGDHDALLHATEDVLHQPARFVLAPTSGELVDKLRKAGIAAFLSGAGPSVTVLTDDPGRAESAARAAAPDGWLVRTVAIANEGARVIERN